MSAIEVRELSVYAHERPTPPILDRISLSIEPGECLAIVGESGAGKSVLSRTLLGLVQADPGWHVQAAALTIAGRDMRNARQRDWRTLRGQEVGLILQDALQSLDPLRIIEAEVGEALAVRDRRQLLARPRAHRRVQVLEALRLAGLPDAERYLRQRSGELSGGMRQRALIASALVADPQLLIADEPTTALDPTTADHVLELFATLKTRGTALLLISHDLQSVSRIADRIAVLDHGRIVEIGGAPDILNHPQHPVTQRLLAAVPMGSKQGPTPVIGPPLVTVRHASRSFGVAPSLLTRGSANTTLALDDVTLTLHRGEAVGVLGESGAGKTTLARVLVGAERLDEGSVERIAEGCRIRLVPQDPISTFDPRWSVERIIATSNRLQGVSVAELLVSVGLDATLARRHPTTLSGGQRQRVAIARALATDPDVLVCDEPVSALDVATQFGILNLLRSLQRDRSLTLLLVSHDLAALRTISDRLVVMHNGKIIEQGPTEQVFNRLE